MSLSRYLLEFVNDNPGKSVGAIAGFLLGILILAFGVLKTIVVILFVVLGIIIGKMADDRISIIDEIRKIFRR
ncbi:MAG TPA: DUF2273 domain-containing protein [Spirochaetota bacterium]|nr:DUF2273 domain-containing protein [Spirochaetota bacterium]HPF05382.1 DUF2273 domain-containing protein [Spirochaetota bacterium]HPJ42340.1 DUF2273 domain-containing protein [Spirochaetota bacterium]HPR36131.1 DUF2273 domain-containing protein [Spirochaetota bacterium]HRX47803.1 DUF2273 domain-containing protein [Spirochaetota bacterium]